ncbi:hypothetical protein ACTFR8_22370 [Bacillus cereus group sp. MYBK15-3]|uniref:hypothetical protein n=1 Tax=Bacillus cereus group TaxID=86661 RepID=UPI001C8BE176|nr:hypothetical protein [Bacillus cereus]MBX9158347.1 hypothetical protein [Bacillus cereus]
MLSIKLQGIGETPAVKAKDLVVGSVTVWNFGFHETVTSITPSKTGKTIKVGIEYKNREGQTTTSERKLRADRLVGIVK